MWGASIDQIHTLQIDMIDGEYVDNITIGPADLVDIDFGEAKIDLHLMTNEPVDYVFEAVEVRDSLPIRAVIGQIERMGSQNVFLEVVKKNNWLCGLSLDFYTPLESINDEIWPHLDILQLMSIEAGFQGQDFREEILAKVRDAVLLRKQLGRQFELVIDGGVKPAHVEKLADLRVDSITVGSGLWASDDILEAVKKYA